MIELSGYEFRRDADGDWIGSIHSGHEILFRPAAETLSAALDEIERLRAEVTYQESEEAISITDELRGKCAWCANCSECRDVQERAAVEIERLQAIVDRVPKTVDGAYANASQPTAHEFDSSRTCNYCGIAAERVPGNADDAICPARREKARKP